MSRCFRVLGLTEKATKSQVEDAYRRKVARYKGPDYQEEPEYANRKLMELKGAYEEALRLARTEKPSTSTRRISSAKVLERTTATSMTKDASKPSSSKGLRDGERNDEEHVFREKFHRWLEVQDDKRAERKNRRGNDTSRTSSRRSFKTSTKKGKQKLSDKFPELKKLSAENLKSAWNEFKADAAGLASATFDDDGFDPFAEDRVEQQKQSKKSDLTDSGERLSKGGTVVAKTKEKKSGGGEIVSIIVTLLIAGFTLFGSCGDDSISYEDEYDYVDEYGIEYEYDHIDNYTDLTDEDIRIQELAEGSSEQLYMQDEYGSAHWSIDSEEELQPIADTFAKKYWGRDNLKAVTEHLQIEFSEYPGNPSMTLDQQLNYIFPFYGFLPVDKAQWYENTYTGERIQCFADYLNYLIQYYDEYYQNEMQTSSLTECENAADSDLKISEMASASAELLYEQESEPFSYTMISMEDESALENQASAFAKYYWGKDTIEEVTLYLNETYETYPVDENASLEAQLDAIFAFYGFAPSEDAVWYKNPYTQGRIKSCTYYLIYLIDYYKATQ